jgi:hypothetical protein
MIMLKTPIVAVLWMLVVVLAPASAVAQIAPSPWWGEPINTPDRFVVLASYNNQAVYDQETGLVWERSPATTLRNWSFAVLACNISAVGNRYGWRLPTVQELASLIDPTVPAPGPTLPAGHPFSSVQSSAYWSATTVLVDATQAWNVFFDLGTPGRQSRVDAFGIWCVRGGQGTPAQ